MDQNPQPPPLNYQLIEAWASNKMPATSSGESSMQNLIPMAQLHDSSWDQPQQGNVPIVSQTPQSPDSVDDNSWELERNRYERHLEEKTAQLSTELSGQIFTEDWSCAVHTLKLILDLDPTRRHPPLYNWHPQQWGPVAIAISGWGNH
ncbi:Uncharacterized protein APZ42_018577 [Daphnia magna]|uniref:Uncharacterized protein n=1 Tax=Daphnia magna TaxID=35525 RepID=A0A164Z070_9CRUS|nr:Uncharacterized protein APZ42_018577 [Daphnia magna]